MNEDIIKSLKNKFLKVFDYNEDDCSHDKQLWVNIRIGSIKHLNAISNIFKNIGCNKKQQSEYLELLSDRFFEDKFGKKKSKKLKKYEDIEAKNNLIIYKLIHCKDNIDLKYNAVAKALEIYKNKKIPEYIAENGLWRMYFLDNIDQLNKFMEFYSKFS